MLTMTAEWSQRTALTTFALEPRRGRVLAAKVVASLAISVTGGCLAFAIAQAGLAVALADGRHPAVGWSWPELAGFAAFVVLTTAIGSAIGSALHNTAATFTKPSKSNQLPNLPFCFECYLFRNSCPEKSVGRRSVKSCPPLPTKPPLS
jgi:hypothetical protein